MTTSATGSHYCRVGWSTADNPLRKLLDIYELYTELCQVNFRSLVGRARATKGAEGEPVMQVGSELQLDISRKVNMRSPYDGDIICRLDTQVNNLVIFANSRAKYCL